jgi:hypothetical protein
MAAMRIVQQAGSSVAVSVLLMQCNRLADASQRCTAAARTELLEAVAVLHLCSCTSPVLYTVLLTWCPGTPPAAAAVSLPAALRCRPRLCAAAAAVPAQSKSTPAHMCALQERRVVW